MNIFKKFHLKKKSPKSAGSDTATREAITPQTATREAITPQIEANPLGHILKICPPKTLRQNAILLENQPCIDSLYIVTRGALSLSLSTGDTCYSLELQEGCVFGFLDRAYYHACLYSIKSQRISIIVELNKSKFNTLSDNIKNHMIRERDKSLKKIFIDAIAELPHISRKNKILISYIENIESQREMVINSKLIQHELINIPKLPPYSNELLSKLVYDGTSINEVIEIVRQDTALAGIMLKSVNSAYYGVARKISSIHHAIAYLGFDNIYQVLINDSINSIIRNNKESLDIQIHSVIVSIISKEIADHLKHSNKNNPMTIGLLHDVGKIVIILLKRKHQQIKEIIETLDGAILGAELLKTWDLPDCIFEVVKNQHLPEYRPPDHITHQYKDDIVILYISHICYDILMKKHTTSTMYLDEYLLYLNMPQKNIKQLYHDVVLPMLLQQSKRLPPAVRDMITVQLPAQKNS